jgi:hypothetical protein
MSLDIDFVCAMSTDIDLPFASCTLSLDIDCACHSTFNSSCIMSLDNVRQLTRSATFDYSFCILVSFWCSSINTKWIFLGIKQRSSPPKRFDLVRNLLCHNTVPFDPRDTAIRDIIRCES